MSETGWHADELPCSCLFMSLVFEAMVNGYFFCQGGPALHGIWPYSLDTLFCVLNRATLHASLLCMAVQMNLLFVHTDFFLQSTFILLFQHAQLDPLQSSVCQSGLPGCRGSPGYLSHRAAAFYSGGGEPEGLLNPVGEITDCRSLDLGGYLGWFLIDLYQQTILRLLHQSGSQCTLMWAGWQLPKWDLSLSFGRQLFRKVRVKIGQASTPSYP